MKKIIIMEVDENGNEVSKQEYVAGESRDGSFSQYARCFDETSSQWTRDSSYNLAFLRIMLDRANAILKSRGYLFLNEVYDMLGLPKSKAGQLVGWIYSEDNKSGDNFVDFGIYQDHNADFVNGHKTSAWLDFNVDGLIFDKF